MYRGGGLRYGSACEQNRIIYNVSGLNSSKQIKKKNQVHVGQLIIDSKCYSY